MSRRTRDGKDEPVPQDQILGRERGQETTNFPRSADHEQEQDWQPYPVDPYSAICDDRPVAPVAQRLARNLVTRWDVSSIPVNWIFLTKK